MPGASTPLRSNLSDFQGTFCDQGNYGSLWTLLTWNQAPDSNNAQVRIYLDSENQELHAELHAGNQKIRKESLSYSYRAPYLWIQRHFEISGWPQQFWMRLASDESALLILPPDEEPNSPFRSHSRSSEGKRCENQPF